MTAFDFRLVTDVAAGNGRHRDLPRLLHERGWVRPGAVVDSSVTDTEPVRHILSSLEQMRGEEIPTVEVAVDREPDYDYLDDCTDALRGAEVDCLIGIGGGSAMDLCKGVCVLLRNPGKGVEYRGMDQVCQPGVPCILVPTTAGTGSEASFTAVFIDRATKTKMGINGRYVSPDLAILDPALTASCPHRVAVAAGLDAMVHALEAFTTAGSHPIVYGLAQQAFSHLFQAFPRAINDPMGHDARLEMLVGAYLAGITLRYSGGGIAGALSYPLGAEFDVPHGLAGGLLLPHIVRSNIDRGYEGYAILARRMFADAAPTVAERSAQFYERFVELLGLIDAPTTFAGYSVRRGDIPRIVDQTIVQREAVLRNNPAPVDEGFLTGILESVIEV